MNAEQKQRIAHEISKWDAAYKSSCGVSTLLSVATSMRGLLQELVDAHEPKPVARVTGYYAGYLSIATVDGRVLPAGTALYAATPHQSEQPLEMVNAPAPSVPDNVARDAARLDWLDERNAPHGLGWETIQMPAGNVHIHTLTGDKAKFGSIREAIDAAIVAAAEREACAKIVDVYDYARFSEECAAAIRARGGKGQS